MSTHDAPTVFISYSHQDEPWKDRLKIHLEVLQEQGLLTLLEDRQIGVGEDWYQKIQSTIKVADVAVLLVSAHFLSSEFIQREEVPRLLRRKKGGLRIYPVIVSSCPWREVEWLRKMQVWPKDGKPLYGHGGNRVNRVLADLATACLKRLGTPTDDPKRPRSAPPTPKVSTGFLANADHKLFGRERELKLLDEVWAGGKLNIFVLVAMGGVGKSSLIKHWMDRVARENYRGAERIYEWSFYSQGTTDQAVSADLFIDSALRWFGDPNPAQGSPRDKGERLAALIREGRTLLILDGMEPLQYPPGKQEGRLKDPTLRVLLRSLARRNPGLCIINTRLRVRDLENLSEGVSQFDLEPLSKQAGAQLLKAQGVNGDEAELEQAAEEFKGHSLALLLLGSYLRDVFDDAHIRHRSEVENLEKDVRYGEHAQHVMASYEKWFGEGPEVAVLRMLGLFKRPADAGAIAALRAQPVIPELTDALQPLSEQEWKQVVAKLRRAKLLAEHDDRGPGVLDAHPLIREHFGRQLKHGCPAAWREGNKRLYQHLKNTARDYPETLAEMAPLYASVAHGCEANLHQEALNEVYQARILRGSEFFSTSKLGAFSAELATLTNFFEQPWLRPVGNLNEASQALVLHEAGFDLRALGRLVEAAQPMRASLGAYTSQEDWKTATVNAGQLSHIYLVIGELAKALAYAQLCVTMADLSEDKFWRPRQRAALAKTLHHMGRLTEAAKKFREAEEMQKQLEPKRGQLYALWGHFYCDLLLSRGQYREAQSRARRSLQWIKAKDWVLMIATDYLSLGRAYLLRARREGRHYLKSAEEHLTNAVEKLRQAGRLDHLPRGLLARAELRLMQGDLTRAWNNLDEAMSIAQSGNMRLHQADCHLKYARLHLEEAGHEKARENLVKAKEMVAEMGYHLRDGEVREIERLLVKAEGRRGRARPPRRG